MGFHATPVVASRSAGLATRQICIMWEACYSCLDETAFLDRDKAWLADKSEMGFRTLERHLLPQLAKLELLVWWNGGFRLPRFYWFHRQNGGHGRQIDRQNAETYLDAYIEAAGIGGAKKRPLFRIVDRHRKLTLKHEIRIVSFYSLSLERPPPRRSLELPA